VTRTSGARSLAGMTPADAGRGETGQRVQGRELRARGKRTLARLLGAGAAVFAERGYHAAKTSHGTFYLYFSSKQDLFHAVAVDVASEMIELARELPPLEPDGAAVDDALRAWLERFADLYRRHGAFIRTWTEAEIADSEIGNIANDLVSQFSRELAVRVRVAAPDLDPGVTAFALVSMIERTTYLVEARQLQVDRADAPATLARATMAALHGPRASGSRLSVAPPPG
jgi:AcrR family transcriptional regulator